MISSPKGVTEQEFAREGGGCFTFLKCLASLYIWMMALLCGLILFVPVISEGINRFKLQASRGPDNVSSEVAEAQGFQESISIDPNIQAPLLLFNPRLLIRWRGGSLFPVIRTLISSLELSPLLWARLRGKGSRGEVCLSGSMLQD